MAVALIVTGLLGAFTYYVSLSALVNKKVSRENGLWLRLVGVPALFISLSVALMSSYFGAEPTLWLSAAIWPVIALTLHSGYKIVLDVLVKEVEGKESEDGHC
ncbi:MAG: hypothetical protein HLX50_01850 [Alteromonadaceae bacterium]|nr:hypothetical protein [Alteromonadaceae bacterium]